MSNKSSLPKTNIHIYKKSFIDLVCKIDRFGSVQVEWTTLLCFWIGVYYNVQYIVLFNILYII